VSETVSQTGLRTQGLMLVRQPFYHLSHLASPWSLGESKALHPIRPLASVRPKCSQLEDGAAGSQTHYQTPIPPP
jgi:hypothetical protein